MKRNTKRFLALFLAFAMAVTPVTSLHAEDAAVQDGASAAAGTEVLQEEEPSVSEPKEPDQTPETENQDTKKEPETEAPEQTEDLTDEDGDQSQDAEEAIQKAAVYAAVSADVPVAIDDAETPAKPAKEIAGLEVLKNDGTAYGMFPVAGAEYEIIGDKIQISFNTGAKSTFDWLYLGYQTDEDKTGYYTGYNTGSTCEFTIQVPLSQKNSWIPISVGRSDKGTWSDNLLWMGIPNVLTLTQQPQSVNAKEGESVSLSVAADGNGVTYQWQYSADGQTWTDCTGDSAQSADYSFVVSPELAGQYRCVVKDNLGIEAVSDAAEVSVQAVSEQEGYKANGGVTAIYASDNAKNPGKAYSMLTIASSQAVVAGEAIEVTIWVSPKTNGFTYDAIYIGSKDDEPKEPVVEGKEDPKKVDAQGRPLQKYTFTVPLSTAGGEVHFVPRSASKGMWSTSSSLALTIPALDEFAKPSEITIVKQPEAEVTATEGTTVSLSVEASGEEGTTLSYQWQYSTDGNNWTECEGLGAQAATYSFTMASDLTGQYRCVVTDTEGTSVTSSVSTVSEPSAPVVTGSKVRVVKSDGTDYKMFTVGESNVVKDGDNLDITISTANVSYDKLYLGSKDDLLKSPVIQGTKLSSGGWTFSFSVPASCAGGVYPVSLGKTDNSWYEGQYLWIYIPDEGIVDVPTQADAIKVIQGGTGSAYTQFAVASSKAVLKNDQVVMTLQVKGNAWTKLYQGVQSDSNKTPVYNGSYDTETGLTTFVVTVPAEKQGMNLAVTPGNDNGWFSYARDLFINVPNLAGNANTTADGVYDLYGSAYPAGNYASLNFERESSVTIKGDTATVTLVTQASSYDKIYIGSVGDADAQKDANAVTAVDRTDIGGSYKSFTFTIPTAQLGKEIGYVVHLKSGNKWAEKQSSFYINGILEKTGELPDDPDEPDEPDDPDEPTVPADGDYKVDVESSASMFRVVDCRLTVKDGQMSAVLTLSGTGYGYLYMGTKEEAAAADPATWIPYVEDSDGKYTYTVPVEALDTGIAVAAYSTKYEKWYDRTLTFQSEGMEAVKPTIEDGTYSIEVETGASMFKVVGAVLTVKDGKMSAVITLSGQGYDYLYMGTKEDAASAGQDAWIPYVADSEGKYTYTVPVEALDTALAAASHSSSRDQWYDRTLTFKSETLKKLSDSASGGDSGTSGGAGTGDGTGSSTVVKPNDGNADSESKYEADINGSTGRVNNSTTLADGVYTPDAFTWSGGTGKVKIYCNKVTITNGQAYATLVFDSDHYQYVKANGNIYYTTKGNGTATVVIPVALNQNNRILAMTTKMSNAHEIAYTIFVYLAGAGNGQGVVSTTNKKLDEEAPEIMGLTYESETVLEYAEYFKIFHYDQGITLLEVDTTRDTARDPEKLEDAGNTADTADAKEEQSEDEKQISEEEIISEEASAEEEETISPEEMAAELYKGNVVKYLLVPEGVEVPVGLDQDMIVVQLPVDKTYVSDEALLKKMDELGLTDGIAAVGTEQKDCKIASIAEKMEKKDGEEKAEISYGGTWEDPDLKELVKQETNLALFPAQLLPRETEEDDAKEEDQKSDDEELTVEEQTERFEEITEKLAMLGIPAIVDRSEDEKTDLAKAEWVKVYGVLFGCEEEMNSIFDAAAEEAKVAAAK